MTFLCYKITNTVNGKVYIGITQRSLSERWRDHLKPVKYNLEQNMHILHEAIKKYGEQAFTIEEIGQSDTAEGVKLLEQMFIRQFNSFYANGAGYNMTYGGDGTTGHIVTEEQRQKMSKSHVGKSKGPHTQETKDKISAIHKINKHGPSKLCNQRRSETGRGVPRSDDVKERIRATLKGRPRPPEVVEKIKAAAKRRKEQRDNGSQT